MSDSLALRLTYIIFDYTFGALHRLWGYWSSLYFYRDPIVNLPNSPQPRLPSELFERIADFLFEPRTKLDSPGRNSSRIILGHRKQNWNILVGFMETSLDLHRIGMVRWMESISVYSSEDLYIALKYSSYVREMRCADGALIGCSDKNILTHFKRLYALSVDSHSDLSLTGNQYAYRKIISALPSTLLRLEILNAHSPDIKIISTIKRYCPNLEELHLGRCTMFNRHPACGFWREFAHDHDSYISDSGIDKYTDSLAQELEPLTKLKLLRMGIYLTSSSAVLAHRLYHTRGLLAPPDIIWQQAIPLAQQPPILQVNDEPIAVEPASIDDLVDLLHQSGQEPDFSPTACSFCNNSFLQASLNAETLANRRLKEALPSLETIEWMGWFTPGHLGVNSYSL